MFFGQQSGQTDVIFPPRVKAKMNVFTLLCCSSIKLPFPTLLVSPGIDECSTGSYVCDMNANCTNTDDSYICACKEGYTGDGHSCQGIITAFDLENSRTKFLKNKKKTHSIKLKNLMFVSVSSNVWQLIFVHRFQ